MNELEFITQAKTMINYLDDLKNQTMLDEDYLYRMDLHDDVATINYCIDGLKDASKLMI